MQQFLLEQVPSVSADQMREVDRVMVHDLGIGLIQMMENAGRSLAELAIASLAPRSVMVLAGPGGNGGGGLVSARHLHNRGLDVRVSLSASEERMGDVPLHQLQILRRLGVPVQEEPSRADLVIDALLGYSLRGDPRGRAGELIEWALTQRRPILALDVPSGVDATTGEVHSPYITADATLTLALPKTGLVRAAETTGNLYLADISVPPVVYLQMGISVPPLFRGGSIVRLIR